MITSETMTSLRSRSTARIFLIAPVIAAFLIIVTTMSIIPTEAFCGKPTSKYLLLGPYSADSPPCGSPCRWRGIAYDKLVGPATVCLVAHAGETNKNEKKDDDFRNDLDEKSTGGGGGGLNNLMKDTKDLMVGDWVVAKRDVPSLGIRAGAGYKLVSIFRKGGTPGKNEGLGVEILSLQYYGDDHANGGDNELSGYQKYLKVYNPRDHNKTGGVVVTPEEIGLVSVKADWTEAALLAVPGFFWVFVAMAFSNYYTDRYGGSFLDAFFRT